MRSEAINSLGNVLIRDVHYVWIAKHCVWQVHNPVKGRDYVLRNRDLFTRSRK